jgi:hypothetical protein
MTDKCKWAEWATVIGEPTNNYDTSCGKTFTLNEGTPKDNSMEFCCFCGKPIEVAACYADIEDDK